MSNTTKSRVKGKCESCGSPISAAKRLCPTCRQQEDEFKQGIRAWKTPAGEAVKRQVRGVRVSEELVFDILGQPLSSDRPSGDFLEALIGVCYARPPYIHAKDVARYVSLLDSLMHYQESNSSMLAVADLPLKVLGPAIRSWIMSYYDEQHHPLLPTYALDTACFIAAHGEGKRIWDWPPVAKISAMVDDEFSIRCIDNPRFKHQFTECMFMRNFVLAEVPEGGSISDYNRQLFGPGTKFIYAITRCFLSQNPRDYIDLKAKEENVPNYDISEALLPGVLWIDESELAIVAPAQTRNGRAMQLYIPLRWVTHAVCQGENGTTLLPVPQWT